MALINEEVEITLNPKTYRYYKNLGYEIPRIKNTYGKSVIPRNTKIFVKVKDLSTYSEEKIYVECDGCNKRLYITAHNYKKCVHEDGKYYCQKCANYGNKKFKSFEEWCIENNKMEILLRFDKELNKCSPNEITYSTHKKYYFKCPKGIHKSELKNIHDFINGHNHTMDCIACDSFANFLVNKYRDITLYWSEKNKVNPWCIKKNSNIKVWIKCVNKLYHEDYVMSCSNFVFGNRCPYCSGKKVHPLDSLGKILEDKGSLDIWSDKNKKSPYEYMPKSDIKVWWKCPDKKHNDFYRSIDSSNHMCNFHCPECQYSNGEKKIEDYLNDNNINYIPQKEFNGLLGLGGRNLSYDFYLPQQNLLIEYQGLQHEKYIKGFHKSKKDFEKQQEHDRRKREYAQNNKIDLLEIWYWDFDNVNTILNQIKKYNEIKKETI